MKPLKTLLAICTLVLLIVIASCKTIKLQPTSQETITVKDSVFTQKLTVDSLLIAREADTVKLKANIDKLVAKPIVKRSKHTQLSIRRVGNTVEAECVADELRQIIELQKEIINHYKETSKERQDTIVIPERYIPQFIKLLAWIGGIFLALILGAVLFRVVKPKIL